MIQQVLPDLHNDTTIAAIATPMNQVEEEEEGDPSEGFQRES
jgi:hypothetical protein